MLGEGPGRGVKNQAFLVGEKGDELSHGLGRFLGVLLKGAGVSWGGLAPGKVNPVLGQGNQGEAKGLVQVLIDFG